MSTRFEAVTLKLRQMIVSRELAPGSRVPERDLADAFGVSRTPVRIALGILEAEGLVARIEQRTARATHPATSPIGRLYEGACAACHETGRAAPLVNAGPALGLSSKLHAQTPTNLVNMLLEGGQHGIGSMPSFATVLDDRQLAELAAYLRRRFAPEQPAWSGIEDVIARARKADH